MKEIDTRLDVILTRVLWVMVLCAPGQFVMAKDINIIPLVDVASTKEMVSLPFIKKEDDAFWQTHPSCWAGRSLDISAKCWMATTKEAILLHVVVADPEHTNDYDGRNLWRGDALHVSLDARGDSRVKALASGDFAIDDAVYVFGLGKNGPEGRSVQHGRADQRDKNHNHLVRSIVRNERDKTTVYAIAIPWEDVSSGYGQSATLGVALVVAHKNKEGKDLVWGRATANDGQPRQLQSFLLSTDPSDFATVAPNHLRLFETEPGSVTVAVRAEKGAEMRVQLGDDVVLRGVPATGEILRYRVNIPGEKLSLRSDRLVVTVSAATLADTTNVSFVFSTPLLVLQRLQERLEKLSAAADHPIAAQHFEATRLVVEDAFNRLTVEKSAHPERVEQFVNAVEVILAKLPVEDWSWQAHLARGIPMVFVFVSERDRTLQFYTLQFPYRWHADKSYPLTVYLHGAGDDNPLVFLTTAFDNSHQDTLFTDAVIDPADIPPAHRGFILAPWARGNSFYRDAGEDDVWESMAQVINAYEIDRDKLYMSGFSMGCHGAWALAARTPQLWAGINPASGFWKGSDWGGSATQEALLDENVRGIPVVSWVGALDSYMLEGARSFHQRLLGEGMDSRLEVVANLPHTYPYEWFQANLGQLMTQSRMSSKEFSFIADTPKHIGRNGISMKVDLPIKRDALAKFTCRIEGNSAYISSNNTDGLEVVLGDGGLDLQSPVTVFWNDKKVYHGAVKMLALGEPLRPLYDRWVMPF